MLIPDDANSLSEAIPRLRMSLLETEAACSIQVSQVGLKWSSHKANQSTLDLDVCSRSCGSCTRVRHSLSLALSFARHVLLRSTFA